RRECLSHSLSLLMSSFALPIPPGALTGLPSPAYGTLRYRSVIRYQLSVLRRIKAGNEALEHLGNFQVLASPPLPRRLVNIAEVEAVAHPHLHLVRRAHRHRQIAPELRIRSALS